MAITKEIKIEVKENGLDDINKKINNIDNALNDLDSTSKNVMQKPIGESFFDKIKEGVKSAGNYFDNLKQKILNFGSSKKGIDDVDKSLDNLANTNKTVVKSMGDSSNAVLDNGGAMGLLNDATGGLAMTVKDAVEASVLFTKSQKLASIQQAIYSTVVGTSTGAMKLFRIALVATGIGALVVGLGLLIANFDKVKKVVLNLIPGLAKVGEIFTGLIENITDFVGITSDASRELDKLGKEAEKTLSKNKFALDAYGDTYDQYTKRKIEANNKYSEHVKAINEDETLTEKEKLSKLKILRETANREILKAEDDRRSEINKKRKDAQDKINEENKIAAEKQKEEVKKALEKKIQDRKDELTKFNDVEKEFEALRDEKLKTDYEKEKEDKEKKAETMESDLMLSQKRYETQQKQRETDAKNKIQTEQNVKDATLLIAESTASIIDSLEALGLKKSKAAQTIRKGIALAQIAVDTSTAISTAIPMAIKAGKEAAAVAGPAAPFVGPLATIASYAGSASMIFSNVAKAKQLLGSGGGGGGGDVGGRGSSGSTPSAPSFNLVQGTGTNQIAQGLSQQGAPIKAYVVSSDVSTSQSLDRNIVSEASLG